MRKLRLAALVLLGLLAILVIPRADSAPSLGSWPQVFVVRSDGSGLKQVTRGGRFKSHPTFSPDARRLAYLERGIVVATLRTGKARTLRRTRQTGAGPVDWSPRRNELVYTYGSGTEDRPRTHLALIRSTGRGFNRLATWTGGAVEKGVPQWSPNGRAIAYARERARRNPPSGAPGDPYCICGPTNVSVVSRSGAHSQFELKGDELHPTWSPDSRQILFGRQERSRFDGLWRISGRGKQLQRVGPRIVYAIAPLSWSPDGRRVGFTGHSDAGARDQALFVLDATPAGVPRLIAEHVGGSAWSPTEDLIAFTDFEGHVRVTAPDGSGQRTLATFAADTEFRYLTWSRDGRWLAFTAEKERPSG
jgi:TolB protein